MSKKRNSLDWLSEKRNMRNIYYSVLGRPTQIKDIIEEDGEIGFTSEDGNIYLAYYHSIMEKMPKGNYEVFRLGVFAHEMLHQVFTNFTYRTKLIDGLKYNTEKQIFASISNILEDASIEYYAPLIMGDYLLKSLRYTNAWIYKTTNSLEDCPNPLSEFMTAMLHFKCGGLLKGNFQFPEAKEAFVKAAPRLMAGIKEKDAAKRMDISMEIYDISKPLWEEDREIEEMLRELLKGLLEKGLIDPNNKQKKSITIEIEIDMEGMDADEESDGGSGSSGKSKSEKEKESNRNSTLSKLAKEIAEAMAKDDEKNSDTSNPSNSTDTSSNKNSGNGEEQTPNASEEKGKGNENSSCSEKGGSKRPKSNGSSEETSGENGSKNEKNSKDDSLDSCNKETGKDDSEPEDKKGDRGEQEKGNSEQKDGNADSSKENKETDGKETPSESESSNSLKDDLKINKEYREQILEALEREKEKEKAEQEVAKRDEKIPENVNVPMGEKYKHAKSHNKLAEIGMPDVYASIKNAFQPQINSLTTSLRKIFQADLEEKQYRSSGRISLNRARSGKVTSRIFERKREPGNKHDMAIFMLIDESGSMGWGLGGNGLKRSDCARHCAISLAETFSNLKVPIYIMGFTADERANADHIHYVQWNNSPARRTSLTGICDRSNNFDGYSIRYAGEILKRRTEEHKLLIVLSDGAPACHTYRGDGIADTKNAIREVRKFASVLGIAIGNSSTKTLHEMYGGDFIHADSPKEMFAKISNGIKNIVKKWN